MLVRRAGGGDMSWREAICIDSINTETAYPIAISVARGAIPAAADEASLINISKRGHPIRRGLRVLDSWVDADRDPGLRRLTNTCMRANAQRLCACASVGQGQSRRPEKTRRMGSFLCFMF